MFFQKYIFGDTAVYYMETPVEGHEGKTTVGFTAYPAAWKLKEGVELFCDSLIQAAFTGDEGLIDYTQGVTMRNREGSLVKVESQAADEKGVTTLLSDERGNLYTHVLTYSEKTGVFTSYVVYENASEEERTLEMLASLSLSGIIAPSMGSISTVGLRLHRMTSAWSRECRLKTDEFSHLGLDMSWGRYGVKVEKWGQVGSMPNRGYFPFAAIEEQDADITWGVMQEAPYSWQMEVYEEKESCSLTSGMGDYEFAHWRKAIPAGGTFTTPKAFFTVKAGGVDAVCNALVHEQDARLQVPASEEEMPVLFNEYCTTWGVPSEENIRAISGHESVEIAACGKNLLPRQTPQTKSGVTLTRRAGFSSRTASPRSANASARRAKCRGSGLNLKTRAGTRNIFTMRTRCSSGTARSSRARTAASSI